MCKFSSSSQLFTTFLVFNIKWCNVINIITNLVISSLIAPCMNQCMCRFFRKDAWFSRFFFSFIWNPTSFRSGTVLLFRQHGATKKLMKRMFAWTLYELCVVEHKRKHTRAFPTVPQTRYSVFDAEEGNRGRTTEGSHVVKQESWQFFLLFLFSITSDVIVTRQLWSFFGFHLSRSLLSSRPFSLLRLARGHRCPAHQVQHLCERHRQVGFHAPPRSGAERPHPALCPAAGPRSRSHHKEPGGTDSARPGHGNNRPSKCSLYENITVSKWL